MSSKQEIDINAIKEEIFDKVNKDDLTKYVLRRQIEQEASAYINRWWKIITTIAAVVLALIGIVGYQQFTSFNSIKENAQKKAEEVDAKSKEVDAKAKEIEEKRSKLELEFGRVSELATMAKEDAHQALEDSRQLIETTQQSSRQAYDVIAQSVGSLNQMYNNMNATQRQLATTQGQLNTQLQESKNNLSELKKTQERIARSLESTEDTAWWIQLLADGFQGEYDKVKEQAQEVRNLGSVQRQISQARTLELVMLRTNKSSNIRMVDFEDLKRTKDYDIKFQTERLRRPYHITIDVTEGKDGVPVHLDCHNIDVANIYRIDGTPFVFKVDFVYHTILSRDFISLKVVHESNLSPFDKSRIRSCTPNGSVAAKSLSNSK
jgi:hypothetical protein